MKKNIVLLLGVCFIILVGAGFAWQMSAALKVETIAVAEEPIQLYFTEDGTVSLTDYYHIYSPVTAEVMAVYVKQDERVTAGTVIAQLDTTEFERQIQIHRNNISAYQAQMGDVLTGERNTKDEYSAQLAQLYAKRSQIEAEMKVSDTGGVSQILPEETLAILQADIEQGEKEVAYYENLYENQKKLYEAGALSKLELDETILLLEKAQTALEQLTKQEYASRQELDRLQTIYGGSADMNTLNAEGRTAGYQAILDEVDAQIESVRENMEKDYAGDMLSYYMALIQNEETAITILQDTIQDCRVTANMDGVIYAIPVQNTTMAYGQSILCTIKPQNSYMIESYVATDDVVALQVGDEVALIQKTRGQDIVYAGEIDYIANWAEETVSTLGLIEHRVKVIIRPLADLAQAGEGFSLDVKYFYYEDAAGIMAPKSALFEFQDEHYVFIVQDGAAQKRKVVTGPSSTTQTVILSGLSAGDTVIRYASMEGLREGVKVKSI